jgi:hypothetical protein
VCVRVLVCVRHCVCVCVCVCVSVRVCVCLRSCIYHHVCVVSVPQCICTSLCLCVSNEVLVKVISPFLTASVCVYSTPAPGVTSSICDTIVAEFISAYVIRLFYCYQYKAKLPLENS